MEGLEDGSDAKTHWGISCRTDIWPKVAEDVEACCPTSGICYYKIGIPTRFHSSLKAPLLTGNAQTRDIWAYDWRLHLTSPF